MEEIVHQVKVPWATGIHIRPAGKISKLLRQFSSDVQFVKNDSKCNAKSIMHLLTLEAECGEQITVIAKGIDAKEAIEALDLIFQEGDDVVDNGVGVL